MSRALIETPVWELEVLNVGEDVLTLRREYDRLSSELEALHSWDGLMMLLDEHWPEDIFPTEPVDKDTRDSGPRIVSLIRWVDKHRDR